MGEIYSTPEEFQRSLSDEERERISGLEEAEELYPVPQGASPDLEERLNLPGEHSIPVLQELMAKSGKQLSAGLARAFINNIRRDKINEYLKSKGSEISS